MECISSKDAKTNFGALLDKVQKTPVIIQKHQRDCAVILSMEEYEIYKKAKVSVLKKICAKASKEAQENGLTPEKLEELLSEEDI